MTNENERQAFSLFCRGKNKAEIASILGVSRKKVDDAIHKQKQINHATLQRINKQDYVGIAMQRFAEIRDEVWTNLSNAKKTSDHAKYLKLAMDLEIKEASFLEGMGMLGLGNQGQAQEMNINIITQLKGEHGVPSLDALALSVLSHSTGRPASELLEMQGSKKNVLAIPKPVGLRQELPEPSPNAINVVDMIEKEQE